VTTVRIATETDVGLPDGRTLHVYDIPPGEADTRLTVLWHHGTPNTGEPPEPLLAASSRLGVRWVGFDRPGYGGSTPHPGRTVGSVADDAAAVADALDVERFAVMGHSGGGPHVLACAALLPRRVIAAVSISGLAPFDAVELDWFAGINASGTAELRAATRGRAALERTLADGDYDPEMFTPADHAALENDQAWLMTVVRRGGANGPGPMVDDDLAAVSPWGFDPSEISAPVLILHGEQDRVVPVDHGRWLAGTCPSSQLRTGPDDGHISILNSAHTALDWLIEVADAAASQP